MPAGNPGSDVVVDLADGCTGHHPGRTIGCVDGDRPEAGDIDDDEGIVAGGDIGHVLVVVAAAPDRDAEAVGPAAGDGRLGISGARREDDECGLGGAGGEEPDVLDGVAEDGGVWGVNVVSGGDGGIHSINA